MKLFIPFISAVLLATATASKRSLECDKTPILCVSETEYTICNNDVDWSILKKIKIQCPKGLICQESGEQPCVSPDSSSEESNERASKEKQKQNKPSKQDIIEMIMNKKKGKEAKRQMILDMMVKSGKISPEMLEKIQSMSDSKKNKKEMKKQMLEKILKKDEDNDKKEKLQEIINSKKSKDKKKIVQEIIMKHIMEKKQNNQE